MRAENFSDTKAISIFIKRRWCSRMQAEFCRPSRPLLVEGLRRPLAGQERQVQGSHVTPRSNQGGEQAPRARASLPRRAGDDPRRWLTLSQIADDLQVSLSTVYRWSARGEPWFPKLIRLAGRQVRVRSDWYDAWLEQLGQSKRSA